MTSKSNQDRVARRGGALLLVLAPFACPSFADNTLHECRIEVTGADFGSYDQSAKAPLDTVGQITVQCFRGPNPGADNIKYKMSLSAGSSGNMLERTMRNGMAPLSYNLYADPARTRVWGDGLGGTHTAHGSIFIPVREQSGEDSHPIYGRIPALQDVPEGEYLDTIVVPSSSRVLCCGSFRTYFDCARAAGLSNKRTPFTPSYGNA